MADDNAGVIQKFGAHDAERAAELEKVLFAGQDPWSAQQFRDSLSAPHLRMFALRPSDTDPRLAGYAVLAQIGPATDPEFEVYNIAVDPQFQGRGFGRALLRAMLDIADAAAAPVFLEVATGNVPARTLYEAHGFSVLGMRPNYYHPSGENAYSMRRAPQPSSAPQTGAAARRGDSG